MSLLGIDVGTSGAKAVLFSGAGAVLASAHHEYHFASPESGQYELDPDQVWRAVAGALREVNASAAARRDPATALAVSASGDEFVLVNRSGRCLHPVLMSMDVRGQPEVEWLEGRLGRERVFAVTGLPLSRKYGLCRMLWYRRHRPDAWAKTWKCLTWEEFIHLRLGVAPVSDSSSIARLMVMDIVTGRLAGELLETAGVDPGRIADFAPSGTVVGVLPATTAGSLGFRSDVAVVTGGFDQAMACLGAGCAEAGQAMVGTGTMEALCVVASPETATRALAGRTAGGAYPWGTHVVPGLYICTATNTGGGLVLRWYRDAFGQAAVGVAEAAGGSGYDVLLAEAQEEPTDLLLLPHLAGSGPPYRDGNSLGALVGLQVRSTRGEVVKAILEGITYELRQNLDHLREAGLAVKALTAAGGGARSDRWLQLKADITGVPIRRARVAEAGCLAAAALAGVGTGAYSSLAEAVKTLVSIEGVFEPDPARHAAYGARYELYLQLYPALKAILHGLRRLPGEGKQ